LQLRWEDREQAGEAGNRQWNIIRRGEKGGRTNRLGRERVRSGVQWEKGDQGRAKLGSEGGTYAELLNIWKGGQTQLKESASEEAKRYGGQEREETIQELKILGGGTKSTRIQ